MQSSSLAVVAALAIRLALAACIVVVAASFSGKDAGWAKPIDSMRRHVAMKETLSSTVHQTSSNSITDRGSKRSRFLNRMAFHQSKSPLFNAKVKVHVEDEIKSSDKYNITTVEDLDSYFADEEGRFRDSKGAIDYDELLKSLSVVGDTQIIGSPDHPDRIHPVLKLLHERKRTNSTCVEGERSDGCRVALAVEGGGMRGCVSAGMVAAIHYLGLEDTIDVLYGSSAGSIIAAYFITRQLPWFGPEIYYDSLTTAGKRFIDTKRLIRAIGFGLVHPLLLKDVLFRPDNGKPVLNLPFLLKYTASENKPLDWSKFVEQQKVQPLKVVASGLRSEKAIVMDMENGSFESMDELTDCMHASCLLPGIAGPLMNMNTRVVEGRGEDGEKKFVVQNNIEGNDFEPMADALLYEPLPYRSAVAEGATHVMVLRTRPDGVDTTGKGSMLERLIMRRFFLRKNKLRNIYRRMRMQLHKKRYGEDILQLNKAAWDDRNYTDLSSPHLMPIALPPGSPEVTRLETGREAIFEGVRRGFARAYDALVEDPAERGNGEKVAKSYFPDEIMNYDPQDFMALNYSAFEAFLEKNRTTAEPVRH